MKIFAIVLAVIFALATAVSIVSLFQGSSDDFALGMRVLSFTPASMLLCFVVILLADIRTALARSVH